MSFGLFTAIGGFISTVATKIGPILSTAANIIATKLPVVLETASVIVSAISNVVTKVSEMLDIVPQEENPEEIGAKTIQEGTRAKGPEETTQEYLDYLRTEVPLDRERFERMSEEEKMGCEIIGDTMLAKSIEEKTGVELPSEFLLTIPQAKLQCETVLALIKAFSDAGISSLNEYTRYISNDMSESEANVVGAAIKSAIQETSPEMTPEEIQREVITMKQEYNTEKN